MGTVSTDVFIIVVSILGAVLLAITALIFALYKQTDARKRITWQLVMERENRDRDRDPLRWFEPATLGHVHTRAGNQCEWYSSRQGRCTNRSEEVDHIYPWWEGGWTIESNAQALCKKHNSMKGSSVPTEALLKAAVKRREKYSNPKEDAIIRWKPTDQERRSRELWLKNGNKSFIPEMPHRFDGKKRRRDANLEKLQEQSKDKQ